MFEGLYFLK